jgi:hypothetical protein
MRFVELLPQPGNFNRIGIRKKDLKHHGGQPCELFSTRTSASSVICGIGFAKRNPSSFKECSNGLRFAPPHPANYLRLLTRYQIASLMVIPLSGKRISAADLGAPCRCGCLAA